MKGDRLVDVLTRHQIYLEGVKLDYAQDFSSVLKELNEGLQDAFGGLRNVPLNSLPKKTINEVVINVMTLQQEIFKRYNEDLIDDLKEFLEVDLLINKILLASVELKNETPVSEQESNKFIAAAWLDEKAKALYPLSYFNGSEAGLLKLWSKIVNAPLPANGALLTSFISAFSVSAIASVENIIRKGYANGWNVEETLDAIIGTKTANFRDGQFFRINSQASAVISTLLQHVSSITSAAVSSFVYEKYQWISVIDNVTTEICRSRNGKVFEYGKGPLPPAHIRCRSKTIPFLVSEHKTPESYFEWLSMQPEAIQNDILGEKRGALLRQGKLKAKDLAKFNEASPLSLNGFKSKLSNMLLK